MPASEDKWLARLSKIATISLYLLVIAAFCTLALLLKDLVQLFVFGLLINYLLSKPTELLTKFIRFRPLAILICFTLIFWFFISVGSYIYPIIIEQSHILEESLPQVTSQLQKLLNNNDLKIECQDLSNKLIGLLNGGTHQLLTKSLLRSVNIITQFVLTIVISFYLLSDGKRLWELFVTLFPKHYANDLKAIKQRIDQNLYGLVLGQFQLAVLTTLVMLSTYLLIANEFALLLGALQMLEFIPILGTWVAIVPSIIIVAATSGPSKALIVAGIYLVYTQIIRDHIIAPRVIGKAFGVHPLVVIFGLMIGIKVFGLIGILVSLPIIAISSAVIDYLIKMRNKTDA